MSTLRSLCGLLLCVCSVLASCKSEKYNLELRPQGQVLQRELSVWAEADKSDESEFDEFPEAPLQRIVAAYGAGMPANLATVHRYAGEFGPDMPDDIGGSGLYLNWPTSLGSAYVYVEQFRGNDELNFGIERQQTTVNRAVDVLVLWLNTEFEDSNDLRFLVSATDQKIRGDVLDMAAHGWADDIFASEALSQDEMLTRLGYYMVKRGYLNGAELPDMYHAVHALSTHDDSGPLADILSRGLARRIGIRPDQPVPSPLEAIRDDWESYYGSLEEFLESNAELKALERSWQSTDGGEATDPVTASDVLESVFPFEFISFGTPGSGHLLARLHTLYEPDVTNGEWHEDVGAVVWDESLAVDADQTLRVPNHHFAMWAKPAVDFQLQHFGNVAITGEFLSEYGIWRVGLGQERGEEWDLFLDSVQSDADFVQRVADFKFSDSSDDVEETYATSYSVIKNLVEELAPDDE